MHVIVVCYNVLLILFYAAQVRHCHDTDLGSTPEQLDGRGKDRGDEAAHTPSSEDLRRRGLGPRIPVVLQHKPMGMSGMAWDGVVI